MDTNRSGCPISADSSDNQCSVDTNSGGWLISAYPNPTKCPADANASRSPASTNPVSVKCPVDANASRSPISTAPDHCPVRGAAARGSTGFGRSPRRPTETRLNLHGLGRRGPEVGPQKARRRDPSEPASTDRRQTRAFNTG